MATAVDKKKDDKKKLTASTAAAAPIGKPIMPDAKGDAIGMPIGRMVTPPAPATDMIGDVSQPPPAPVDNPSQMMSIGPQINPTVRGASDSPDSVLSGLLAQKPPRERDDYHGIKRIGDALLGATTIGTAIQQAGGFGSAGYDARLSRAERNVKDENALISGQESSDKAAADVAQTQAETAGIQTGNEVVQVPTTGGGSQGIMRKNVAGPTTAVINQAGANDRTAQQQTGETARNQANISARQALQSNAPISLDELASRAVQENDQDTLAKVQHYKETIAKAGGAQPGTYVAIGDAGGNTVGWVNPKAAPDKQFIPVAAIPGVSEAAGGATSIAGTPAIPPKPTSATLTMAEMAKTVQEVQPTVLAQLDKVQHQLGPAVGRWNDLWVNGAGLNDPEFAKLDTMLDLYASAIVRTHFGARGGQQYREELRKQFGEAQTPDDLRARIAGADTFISRYAQPGGGGAPGAPASPAAPAVGGPPPAQPGMKVQSRTVNGQTEYRQVPIGQ